MAAELMGGAFLSSFLNVVFDRLSKPGVVNWIQGKKLDKKLLQRLENILYVVQAVLNDAEQKQVTNPAVKKWLVNLQDAIYKADDLLDEVSTKAATQKHPGTFWSRFLDFEHREMVAKIEEVIGILGEIAEHKDIIGLKNNAKENMSWRIPSTSLVKMSDIYGRDKDREAIVNLLLDDTNDGEISVIPIVGMGGIGKTTLAQLIYNDDKVKQKFDFKAWVCVGEEFDVLKMTKTILEVEAETSGTYNTNDLNSIQLKLKNKLIEKKFLVVLDDMWNDNYDDWKIFQNPFQYGSLGSKIVVTTRNDKVASVVQTVSVPAYKLSLLSDEHCWLVFAKHAFLSAESPNFPILEKVGRKIVEKCKGLPLAAQTLGGLLRTKNEVADWNYILKSEIWEFSENESRIVPALRISYHFLPSYLKRCFVYCSLYPKDYQFDRDELMLLWMAEDLLQPPKSGRTLEEIGYEYFNDLASRSFFQPSNTNEDLFVMHDLMHDLATFYAGEFYFRALELGSAAKVNIKTRHLSYNVGHNFSASRFLEACDSDSLKHARTLLQTNLHPLYLFPEKIAPYISHILSQLKSLRVLSFRQLGLESLPNSIGEMIHLRYLDLSKATIVTLPESLNNLYNLQTLKLRDCEKLKELPSGMQDLINLRHLDLRGTNLEDMPKGMNKLKDLQFLSDYIVGKHEANGIREVGALASLHGSLTITRLENVIHSDEALEARMVDKKHINILNLSWSSDGGIADSQTERDILDKLRPYIDLKELSIIGYRGTTFPDWLGDHSYHNITDVVLEGCSNCCMLPSLGQLPSLKSLRLENFDSLQIIGAEFYKNDESHGVTPFPSLKTLEFYEMSCWRLWQSFEFDAFPQLEELWIRQCPMLTGNLPNLLADLKTLIIEGCNQLACSSLPRAPGILELRIHGKQEARIQELPLSLMHELSISGRQQVEFVFEAMTHTQPTCLRFLRISNCSSAISFPGDCLPASLQELVICDCKNLEFPTQQQQQKQQHESLQSLEINNSCDSLTSFPLSAFPNLTSFKIKRCENIKSLEVSRSHDAAPPSLLVLIIKGCPNYVSLLSQSPNATLPSLHYLSISSCPNFASFSTLGLAAPRLDHLRIKSCPEIESLAEGDEGLPPKLRLLHLIRCEKLVRRLASSTVLQSPGLTQLVINGACESVKSFPREGCLPASLQSLHLVCFPSLETLDCNGLLHLTSLESIAIEDCPKLESMAGERLPASLTELYIRRCPLLRERVRMKDPQIWPYISHIPKIDVDERDRLHDPTS